LAEDAAGFLTGMEPGASCNLERQLVSGGLRCSAEIEESGSRKRTAASTIGSLVRCHLSIELPSGDKGNMRRPKRP